MTAERQPWVLYSGICTRATHIGRNHLRYNDECQRKQCAGPEPRHEREANDRHPGVGGRFAGYILIDERVSNVQRLNDQKAERCDEKYFLCEAAEMKRVREREKMTENVAILLCVYVNIPFGQ